LQRAVFHFRKVHHPSSAEQQAGDTSRSGIRPDRKYLIRLPLNSRKLAESSPMITQLLFGSLFLCSFSVFAQVSTIQLAGAEIKLGATKDQVKPALDALAIGSLGWDTDIVTVFERIGDKVTRQIGNLFFTRGRLASVEKIWRYSSSEDGVALVRALHSLIATVNDRGASRATLRVRSLRSPEASTDTVNIQFTDGSIVQVYAQSIRFGGNETNEATVSETFSRRPLDK
jgi:hypothetical protein